ncbi:MAG: FtsQ-type POTRA domain-containing protein [Oscillospiraceae bacterium]|nr:FtsQ-type POTRA domain-containing protein [Oscillospiraceae bacterium]
MRNKKSEKDLEQANPEQQTERQAASQRFTRVRNNVHMDELRSRQDKKRHRRSVFYFFLFLGATVIFLAVCFFLFFRVSEIQLVGNEIYTEEQILEQLPFSVGENLFSFRVEEAENNLRKALPFIGDVKIKRSLPSVITVEISERHMELSLAVGDDAYLLSGDLQVLERIGGGDITDGVVLLKTGAVERCIVGEKVTFSDARTASDLEELYRCLSANGMMEHIRSIDMTSRFDITMDYEGRFSVYLADIDNMDIKIRFLAGIIEQLSSVDRGYIDLADCHEAAVRLENVPVS